MKFIVLLIVALCCGRAGYAQNSFKAIMRDGQTQQPLAGATALVISFGKGAAADTSGLIILKDIPNGQQIIKFSFVGYQSRLDTLTFPLPQDTTLMVNLQAAENNGLNEIIISATRSSRTIANIPTRVEVISGEELEEKGNMKPGDIRMLLAESTGIQTQQTSATSANADIRIQGLDGRYTQVLRDGFPLYAGFSGGLGLLQIAPLDLKQVEIIKGSSSTLYGGGAIAGLVNLVSKTPEEERQLNLLLNGTSAAGLDASLFYAQKFSKVGITIYAAYNHGSPYDPAGIDLTAIPRFNRYTLNPRLFVYFNPRTTLSVGLNSTAENRIGGDLHYIEGNGSAAHAYFEENRTGRYSLQTQLSHQLNANEKLTLKSSASYFARTINLPGYRFSGVQTATYSEALYNRDGKRANWIAGLNFVTDHFGESRNEAYPLRSYTYNTIGAFVQNELTINPAFSLETGLRVDRHNAYGTFVLPRISALWKISSWVTSRLGGGLGYKAPTVFTEDAERIQFRNVLPVDVQHTRAERSYGANYDVNYRTGLFNDAVSFNINQLFFYTRIANPIRLTLLADGNLQYQQPAGNLTTRGTETNVKLTYQNFKLFLGYTFADVHQQEGTLTALYPLVSRHRLNNVLVYEQEDKWKIGLEAYYFSRQQLNDGATGKPYWTTGLMAERLFVRFSLFINFENLTDTRQTRFDTIYTGSVTNPVFRDIYAPLDGFVVNGGVKVKL
ncbi:TonB-dependent receptor [Mucilaginibacter sp.]